MADENILKRDQNWVPVGGGILETSKEVRPLLLNEITGYLKTDIPALDKSTDDILIYANTAKDGTGTSYIPLLDTAGHLQIDVLSGGGGGTLVKDGAAVDADTTGQIILGTDSSNYQVISTDATGHLQVDVLSGGGAGEQYADNTVVDAGYKGNIILGTDGSNYQIISVDASGNVQVDLVTAAVTNAGTFAVQATLVAETTKIIGTVNIATSQTIATTNAGTFAVQATLAAETTKVIGTINVAASQTIATTNTGTFAVQATLAAETTKVIGTINIAASQTIAVTNAGTFATQATLQTGTNSIGKLGSANSGVDIGDVDVTSVIPGVGATNLGKAIDTALGATDTGVLALGVRDDTLNIRSGTENDCEPLHTDAVGALWVHPTDTIAHDAADAGNPIKIGAKAITALSGVTVVAANDRTNLYADEDGVQVVKNWTTNNDILVERVSNTDGASTASTVFGATANAYNCISTIVVHNAHATTNGYVDIRDGTAGTVLMTIPLPANGGAVLNFPVPLRQTTANTALAFDVSAAITTIFLSFIGYKSKA